MSFSRRSVVHVPGDCSRVQEPRRAPRVERRGSHGDPEGARGQPGRRDWGPSGVCAFEPAADGGQYQRRAKTTEAIDQLDNIYKGAANYYTPPYVERGTGRKLPCRFPESQPLTPDVWGKSCCGGRYDQDGDNRCDVDTGQWATPTWSALNLQRNDQHYFGYEFESEGTMAAARFTARAHADLDCDRELSTFERYGYGDATASMSECVMSGSSAFYKDNEPE